jgi:hypothetical protein
LEIHAASIFRAEVTKLGSRELRVRGRKAKGKGPIRDKECGKRVLANTESSSRLQRMGGGLGRE